MFATFNMPVSNDAVRWGLLIGAGASLLAAFAMLQWQSPSWDMRRIVLGRDNRLAAGKAVAAMWTVIIAACLIAVLYADLIGHPEALRGTRSSVALGQYGLLFGGTLFVALLADGLLGRDTEPPSKSAAERTPAQATSDYQSPAAETSQPASAGQTAAHRNNVDLGTIQYLVVSLVAAAYVLAMLLHEPARGLPHLPGVVVALAIMSAAGYVANTAFQRMGSAFSRGPFTWPLVRMESKDKGPFGATANAADEIGPDPRRWLVSAAGLLAVALVLGSLAFLLWGTGARLRTSEVARVAGGRSSGRDAATWFGIVLLLLLLAQAALTFFKSRAVDAAVKRAADRVNARFRLDLKVVWPHLEAVLSDDTRDGIRNARARADATAAMAAGYWVALPLAVVLLAIARDWPFVLAALVLVAPALAMAASSRAGVAAARYSSALDAVVARHRFDLVRAMRLDLPDTPSDELALNRDLSSFLAGGESLGEKPFAVEFRPEPDQELSHLGGEVRELRKVLADPGLVNWTGFVSLWVKDAEGEANDTLLFPPASLLRAVVAFSETRGPAAAQEEIAISEGQDAATAVFKVSLDSGTIHFPPDELELAAQRGGPEVQAEVGFVAPAEPGEYPLWLEVRQRNRLIQVVRTVLKVAPQAS